MTTTLLPLELAVPTRYDGTQCREATVEHVDPDEGTILLRAVPYEHEVELDRGLFESFAGKAFERSAAAPHRVKLWHEHGGPLIGHAREVEDRPDGLWVNAKISNTLAGQEARELARDGTLTDVSITFRALKDWVKVSRKRDGLHIRHARAYLLGVAMVAHGAYGEAAMVAAVRSESDHQRAFELRKARLLSLDH